MTGNFNQQFRDDRLRGLCPPCRCGQDRRDDRRNDRRDDRRNDRRDDRRNDRNRRDRDNGRRAY